MYCYGVMQLSKCYPFLEYYYLTRPFGKRPSEEGYVDNVHKGVDMQPCDSNYKVPSLGGNLTTIQQTIVSVTSGTITMQQYHKAYGNFIWIENDDGTGAIYCHLKSFFRQVGDKVSCKTPLGIVGTTGNSSAIHLHLGISKYQGYYDTHSVGTPAWIDPLVYLYSEWDGKNWKLLNGEGMITGTTNVSETNVVFQSSTTINNGIANNIIASGEYYQIENLVGTTSDWLFGRRYRILIVLDGNETLDVSEVRCKFNITKTCYNEQNISIIELYNLNPDTENRIIKNGKHIIIEAGYTGSQYGKIFSGGIIQPVRSKDSQVDYKLTLVSVDCDRYVQYGIMCVSLVAQQSQRDAINSCLYNAGKKTKTNFDISSGYIVNTDLKYPRGKILFGKPMDLMDQIAFSNNLSLYTDDGEVNIVSAEGLPDGEIFDLGPDSGLIGTPTQNDVGISGECLLNPNIKLNSLVHINNKKIAGYQYSPGTPVRSLDSEGIYRIIKLTYEGDTRGSDWKTSFDAISQAGMLPGMLVGDAVYTG